MDPLLPIINVVQPNMAIVPTRVPFFVTGFRHSNRGAPRRGEFADNRSSAVGDHHKATKLDPILKVLCATLLAFAITGCSGVLLGGMNSLSGDSRLRTTTEVAFDPGQSLELDVFAPQGARAAPVVVFFYGGYWRNGERGQYRWVGEALARSGVVAVLPDYRKFPAVGLDGFMTDAASAVAWT